MNSSVKNINQWQQENKQMISYLTDQFNKIVENLSSIEIVLGHLNGENSQLIKLINVLKEVMINDENFIKITENLVQAINTLDKNTTAFDNTTNQLNEWVKNQIGFTDSVATLLSRLEEIDQIKDINEIFWNKTKEQLNEGVSIISQATAMMKDELENINDAFYQRLNNTFENLDMLIQRIVDEYQGNRK